MLSVESPARRRGLLLAVIVAISVAAFWHNWLTDQHLTFVSAVQRTDHPIHTPLQRIRPGFTADVHMWIRYALAVLEGEEGLRSHHTAVDNPPAGREMHWNSGLVAWLAALGWSWHKVSGTPLPAAVERAAVWANLPLLIAFVAGFGWWAARRASALAGALVAVAIFGHRSLYEGFMPAYPDHHGLIAVAILGLMLGVLFMGGGWVRGAAAVPGIDLLPAEEKRARSAAAWSGFWGGFGLWISTASLAVPLALVVLAAGLATFACRRSLLAAGARFDPGVWRIWGRVGGLTSLGFYLLEYFPSHLGWRLEVNHPLYALAWWAGAEFTAAALAWLASPPAASVAARRTFARRAGWTLPLALAPVAAILVWGAQVFAPADPFMVRLHRTIIEFMPLLTRLRADGVANHFEYIFLFPVLYIGAVGLLFRAAPVARFALWLTLTPVLAFVGAGFLQSRWALSAGSAEVPLLLACLGVLFAFPRAGATFGRRALLAGLAATFLYLPGTVAVLRSQWLNLRGHVVPADEILELTYREIAQAVRDSSPDAPVVLFTSPNASTAIGYYGRFQTLGTLYWENGPGLQAAAALNAAPTDDAAAALIRQLGVTHLVMITQDNYVVEYARLLHPDLSDAAVADTFAYRLLGKKVIPPWLEPVLYRAPRDLPGKLAGLEAYVYKVNFAQTPAQAVYRVGQLLALQDNTAASLDSFAWAAQLNDRDAAPWLRRGEILLRQGRRTESLENFQRGIDLAPSRDRYQLLTQAGIAFESVGDLPTAIDLYRRAIAEPMTNGIALNNLAWRLATTTDATLRDPAQAVTYARQAVAREPGESGNHDTLAAALASNGDYSAAVAVLQTACTLAEKAHDQENLAAYRRHLAAFQAQHPWRE